MTQHALTEAPTLPPIDEIRARFADDYLQSEAFLKAYGRVQDALTGTGRPADVSTITASHEMSDVLRMAGYPEDRIQAIHTEVFHAISLSYCRTETGKAEIGG